MTAEGTEETQDNEIKVLRVADIAADDCVLGLWCTDPHRGVDVMRAWGRAVKSTERPAQGDRTPHV